MGTDHARQPHRLRHNDARVKSAESEQIIDAIEFPGLPYVAALEVKRLLATTCSRGVADQAKTMARLNRG